MQRTTLSHVSEPTFPTSESVDTCIIMHLDSAEKYYLASAFFFKARFSKVNALSVNLMYKLFFSTKLSLQMDHITLFIYLKIILLPYFQFSIK